MWRAEICLADISLKRALAHKSNDTVQHSVCYLWRFFNKALGLNLYLPQVGRKKQDTGVRRGNVLSSGSVSLTLTEYFYFNKTDSGLSILSAVLMTIHLWSFKSCEYGRIIWKKHRIGNSGSVNVAYYIKIVYLNHLNFRYQIHYVCPNSSRNIELGTTVLYKYQKILLW